MAQQNSLAVIEDYSTALAKGTADGAMMRGILGPGEQVSFSVLERLRVPAGGAKNWELPNGQAAPTFTGVVLHRHMVRAYWRAPFAGGGEPPDCSSMDGINGIGDPGGECEHCPLDRWGSARGEKDEERRGKACRQLTRLFILTPESALPTLLVLPPSSYQEGQNYALRLAARRTPYWSVVTEAALVQDSSGGIKYSKVALKAVGRLSDEAIKHVERVREQLIPILTAARPSDADYEPEG